MHTWSRGLREETLRGLAGLGLVLALTVMALVFAVSAAQGDSANVDLASSGSGASSVASEPKQADLDGGPTGPSAIGLVLGVLVLGTGVTVLALGARRPKRDADLSEILAAE